MVATLADAVAATLRSRTHALHSNAFVNEHLRDEEFAVLSLAVILSFPVCNSRTQQFLNVSSSLLLREAEYTECAVNLQATNHVYNVAHLAW